MISNYNKAIIKELNPKLLEKLEKLEKNEPKEVQVIPAKNGELTLMVQANGQWNYLHSRYHPSYEAEQLLDSCSDITEESNVVIYGVGLGYHIKEVVRRFPEMKVYLVEPNIELLYTFLENFEIKDNILKNLEGISSDLKELDTKIPEFDLKYPKLLRLLWLKGYARYCPKGFEEFKNIYVRAFRNEVQRVGFYEDSQARLVINEMHNLKEILGGKQLFGGENSYWKGKTAIIVAAGPSLDEEIENLREIKEKGMAYLFAVGSAVNTMLSKGIHPDGLFSYDPSEKNQIVVRKIKEENIADVPILFGGIIGHETLLDYPGEKIYIKNGENFIQNFLLKPKTEIPMIQLGSTVSVMAIDAALHMGFENIILVGQNLGVTGERSYSSGIDYLSNRIFISEQYSENEKNVHGQTIRTSPVYLMMRKDIESVIKNKKSDAKVWNSTRNGLQINGAEYRPLSELMQTMKEKSVEPLWYEKVERKEYDLKQLQKKIEELEYSKQDCEKQFERLKGIVVDIKKNAELELFAGLSKLYTKLQLNLKRLEENKYSSLLILTAMIQEYHSLILRIDHLNSIQDKKLQALSIYEEFQNFAGFYQATLKVMESPFEEMIAFLKSYCEREINDASNN